MEFEEAVKEFDAVHKEYKVLRARMLYLNKIIGESGGHPKEQQRISRNKQFFQLWKSGLKYTHIAREYDVSQSTVRSVCKMINRSLNNPEHIHYKDYKDLKQFTL